MGNCEFNQICWRNISIGLNEDFVLSHGLHVIAHGIIIEFFVFALFFCFIIVNISFCKNGFYNHKDLQELLLSMHRYKVLFVMFCLHKWFSSYFSIILGESFGKFFCSLHILYFCFKSTLSKNNLFFFSSIGWVRLVTYLTTCPHSYCTRNVSSFTCERIYRPIGLYYVQRSKGQY